MKETNTVWKPVVGYEGLYEVSQNADVKNVLTRKILKPRVKKKTGYVDITLVKNKIRKTFLLHRLIAMAFIKNDLTKLEVNHIDGDKCNNHYSNLEWCTHKENMRHAWKMGLNKNTKKQRDAAKLIARKYLIKPVIDIEMGIFYDSLKDACNTTNINYGAIRNRIHRKSKNIRFQYI